MSAGHQGEGARFRKDGKGQGRLSTAAVHDGERCSSAVDVLEFARFRTGNRKNQPVATNILEPCSLGSRPTTRGLAGVSCIHRQLAFGTVFGCCGTVWKRSHLLRTGLGNFGVVVCSRHEWNACSISCSSLGGFVAMHRLTMPAPACTFEMWSVRCAAASWPCYQKVGTALEQLLEVEARRCEGVYGPDSLCVGLARLGQPTQKIAAAKMRYGGLRARFTFLVAGSPPFYLVARR